MNKIVRNEGMRSLSKIMLNSHWGRFAMRSNKMNKQFISDKNQLLHLITNPATEVHSLFPLSDTSLLAAYKFDEVCTPVQPDVNIILAA